MISLTIYICGSIASYIAGTIYFCLCDDDKSVSSLLITSVCSIIGSWITFIAFMIGIVRELKILYRHKKPERKVKRINK